MQLLPLSSTLTSSPLIRWFMKDTPFTIYLLAFTHSVCLHPCLHAAQFLYITRLHICMVLQCSMLLCGRISGILNETSYKHSRIIEGNLSNFHCMYIFFFSAEIWASSTTTSVFVYTNTTLDPVHSLAFLYKVTVAKERNLSRTLSEWERAVADRCFDYSAFISLC